MSTAKATRVSSSASSGVDPALVKLLGVARARTFGRVMKDTGLAQEVLLKFAVDVMELALQNLKVKAPEAVQMGHARWGKLSPEERSEVARRAVAARWAKYRDMKKVEDPQDG
jgi:hypothetical protein